MRELSAALFPFCRGQQCQAALKAIEVTLVRARSARGAALSESEAQAKRVSWSD